MKKFEARYHVIFNTIYDWKDDTFPRRRFEAESLKKAKLKANVLMSHLGNYDSRVSLVSLKEISYQTSRVLI